MELFKKLRLNSDLPLWLINAPADCLDYFAGFTIKKKTGKEKPVQQLILFAVNSIELIKYMELLAGYISPDTLFWICYPKKSGSISSDLARMNTWDMVVQSGYRAQTSIAIDNNWTGIRCTNAPQKNSSDRLIPMADRKAEGIDFANRTVQLPPDAQAAIDKYKGLSEYFYAQSFTCKKEYLAAITDAKKEETRIRRIEKMIEMLLPKMHARQLKKN